MRRNVAIGLACCLLIGCKEELYTNLQEEQANEVVATLRAHGIAADKSTGLEGVWVVKVESSRFGDAVTVLRARGVPSSPISGLGETFKRQGLVSTPIEERARLTHAISEELSKTLAQIDGVVIARVHVVMPEREGVVDQQRTASATVFIKHRPDVDMAHQISKIKAIVANGVDGATYETVSVSLFPAQPPQPLNAGAGPQPSATTQVSRLLLAVGVGAVVLAALAYLFTRLGGAASKALKVSLRGRAGRAS